MLPYGVILRGSWGFFLILIAQNSRVGELYRTVVEMVEEEDANVTNV